MVTIPQAYRRSATSIGVWTYRATDEPIQIIQRLQNNYGRPTPGEKEKMSIVGAHRGIN